MKQKIIRKEVEAPKEPKVPETDEEFCIGCNICVKICPRNLIELAEEPLLEGVFSGVAEIPQGKKRVKVSTPPGTDSLPEFCIQCMKCVKECPANARRF